MALNTPPKGPWIMNTHQIIAVIVLLLALANVATAGLGTTTGKEPGRWTDDQYNVVVGVITNVQRVRGEGYQPYQATISPRATLGGTLDPSLHSSLPVRFYVSELTSSINRPPPEGATVMAVVQFLPKEAPGQQDAGFIVSDLCTFMPDRSALVVIKGLDDPRVAETLKKLQDARAHPNADPNAPKPANAPSKDAANRGD
jgi:hypothetical protein